MRQINEVHGVFVYVAFQELSRKWVWVLTTAGARERPLKCVLLYGFCSSIHCYRHGNTGCTITYRLSGKVGSWSPHPQLLILKLLIWTLLLVLSLSILSRASKPGIGVNSILRTCEFINSCVYSRSTRNPYIHACPSSVCTLGTTLVQVHKLILYIYTLFKIRICMAQLIHFRRDSLAFNCL